jgi:hypothetical protein
MIFTVSCLSIKLLLATPFMYNLIWQTQQSRKFSR